MVQVRYTFFEQKLICTQVMLLNLFFAMKTYVNKIVHPTTFIHTLGNQKHFLQMFLNKNLISNPQCPTWCGTIPVWWLSHDPLDLSLNTLIKHLEETCEQTEPKTFGYYYPSSVYSWFKKLLFLLHSNWQGNLMKFKQYIGCFQ